MPGAYAHITMVNIVRARIRRAADVPSNVKIAASDYLRFCEMGSVSPDYPYLDALNSNSAAWADLMHYTHTTDMIKQGALRVGALHGPVQSKCLAWLLGYAAHVAGDVTIHPIVELKVGDYANNKTNHRICELHQDTYIYSERMNLGNIGLSEHLDGTNSGIMSCHRSGDTDRIDDAIFDLWTGMLKDVHGVKYLENAPDIDRWHAKFGSNVDLIEDGNRLPHFAQYIAASAGLTYPDQANLDEYIHALETPEAPMEYGDIFDRACDNIIKMWIKVGHDVEAGKIDELADLGHWNLDTGRDETGTLVYWDR